MGLEPSYHQDLPVGQTGAAVVYVAHIEVAREVSRPLSL